VTTLAGGREVRLAAHGGLRWTFFAAWHGETPVANVCAWDADGAEIVGHVYTRPEWRGLGLAGALFVLHRRVSEQRGIRFSQLNTDAGSFQEAFYRRHGYEPVPGVPGAMFRGEWPADDRLYAEPFEWSHWPRLNARALRQGGRSLEGPVLEEMFG